MYLYVKKGYSLEQLPDSLRAAFGRAELAMTLLLTAERKLARADVTKVMASIDAQDFYLQMPPATGNGSDPFIDDKSSGERGNQ